MFNKNTVSAITSPKRVAVFQAHLKLVREKTRAKLSNNDNSHSTSQGSNFLSVGGHYK